MTCSGFRAQGGAGQQCIARFAWVKLAQVCVLMLWRLGPDDTSDVNFSRHRIRFYINDDAHAGDIVDDGVAIAVFSLSNIGQRTKDVSKRYVAIAAG
jgi:hypothetical protein